MLIYFKKQALIRIKAQVKALIFKKVFIIVLAKYFNYNNSFLIENCKTINLVL